MERHSAIKLFILLSNHRESLLSNIFLLSLLDVLNEVCCSKRFGITIRHLRLVWRSGELEHQLSICLVISFINSLV